MEVVCALASRSDVEALLPALRAVAGLGLAMPSQLSQAGWSMIALSLLRRARRGNAHHVLCGNFDLSYRLRAPTDLDLNPPCMSRVRETSEGGTHGRLMPS